MKNLNLIFVGLFLIISLNTVSGLQEDVMGTYKQYSCVDLIQTCGNCSYVNISSVLYPNSSQALGQVVMTKTGTYYNYSFCKTSLLGAYRVSGHGDIDFPGVPETFTYLFYITPSGGEENNTLFFMIFALTSVVLLIISFIFKNHIFAVISGFALMGTGVYGMIYGFGDITNIYTRIMSVIIIGLGTIISIIAALELMDETYGTDSSYSTSEEDED